MTSVLIATIIVAVSLFAAALVQRIWIKLCVTMILFLCLVLTATADLGSLRVYVEQARAQGESEEFVQGLLTHAKLMQPVLVSILVYGSGLMLVGVSGWLRGTRGRKAENRTGDAFSQNKQNDDNK